MQRPTPKTSVSKCIALGMYAQGMLAQFPDNPVLAELAATLGAATAALSAAQGTYAAAVLAIIAPRVKVRFADYSSDKVVRSVQRAAETADDGKNGKIASAVFPDGVTPIVRPVGQTQCDQMRALEGRLEAAMALWPAAGAEKAKVAAERVKYEAALAGRRDAVEAAATLRAKRDVAKEDFLDVYAATASRVGEQFPRQRAMQDLFFDQVTDAVVADEAADPGDDTEPPASPAPPAPPPA